MKKRIKLWCFALLCMLALPFVLADSTMSGGGGGTLKPTVLTFEECDALHDYTITEYRIAKEQQEKFNKTNAFLFMLVFIAIIVFLLIKLGMSLQENKTKTKRRNK